MAMAAYPFRCPAFYLCCFLALGAFAPAREAKFRAGDVFSRPLAISDSRGPRESATQAAWLSAESNLLRLSLAGAALESELFMRLPPTGCITRVASFTAKFVP